LGLYENNKTFPDLFKKEKKRRAENPKEKRAETADFE
jgi:hypothetical protein